MRLPKPPVASVAHSIGRLREFARVQADQARSSTTTAKTAEGVDEELARFEAALNAFVPIGEWE